MNFLLGQEGPIVLRLCFTFREGTSGKKMPKNQSYENITQPYIPYIEILDVLSFQKYDVFQKKYPPCTAKKISWNFSYGLWLSFFSWNPHLVGGFNPFEKYESNWFTSPSRGENKNVWKHHLAIIFPRNGLIHQRSSWRAKVAPKSDNSTLHLAKSVRSTNGQPRWCRISSINSIFRGCYVRFWLLLLVSGKEGPFKTFKPILTEKNRSSEISHSNMLGSWKFTQIGHMCVCKAASFRFWFTSACLYHRYVIW